LLDLFLHLPDQYFLLPANLLRFLKALGQLAEFKRRLPHFSSRNAHFVELGLHLRSFSTLADDFLLGFFVQVFVFLGLFQRTCQSLLLFVFFLLVLIEVGRIDRHRR